MSIIIGIDPGTFLTGYGVLDGQKVIDWGLLKPPIRTHPHRRLLLLGEAFCSLLDQYKPDHIALEKAFVGRYARSVIALSHLRGIFIFLSQQRGITLEEYSAKEVKSIFTGRGDSHKQDMIRAVAQRFKLEEERLNDNCADALALAYCSSLLKN